MLSRLSIRAKLTIAFAAALLLVLALAGLFVYQRLESDLTETLDNGLASRADELGALVASTGGGSPELGEGRLVESDEVFSQILSSEGEIVASTLAPSAGPALDPQEIGAATAGETVIVEREVPGIEHEARMLGRPASSAEGTVVVVAGASTEDRVETLTGLTNSFLVGAPIALVLASGIGYLLATRSLSPVDAMRRRAQEITLERSGERLPLPRAEDEIRQLGETLNTMLDRIEASLERERVFVADASHELRTPLAILKTELELADRRERSPEELRHALHSAREEVDRLSRLAEDLLVIARSDQGRLPIKRERVEPAQVLARVRDRFARRAQADDREIVVDAPSGQAADLDPFLIEQALGNLVDNALRHGAGEVRLSARRRDGSVELEVSDDGPGFLPGFEAEAFERFTRPDGGRTGGGAGLGLAIVRAVAAAHGGEATVASGPDGSPTILRITLPVHGP
jgi:two-component system, OmpR family, sensor kinase